MMKKTWTIIDLLNETRQDLEKKGIKTARLDSEILLAHCLNKDRVKLYMDFESPVTSEELTGFRTLVRRRAKREPVAYIVGYKEFWSIKMKVSRDVLVPRPETEVLVEVALGILKKRQHTSKRQMVLELGTGSGAISLALAKERDDVDIISVEISPKALQVAKYNAALNKLDKRIMLVCGDGLNPFKYEDNFDLVVSNPPYIRASDINSLEPEIANHEPRQALDGGKDGLDFYRAWVPKLPLILKTHGWSALEMGDGQAEAISQIFASTGSYQKTTIVKDYAGRERVILARKK